MFAEKGTKKNVNAKANTRTSSRRADTRRATCFAANGASVSTRRRQARAAWKANFVGVSFFLLSTEKKGYKFIYNYINYPFYR